jgi:hypothetical protein
MILTLLLVLASAQHVHDHHANHAHHAAVDQRGDEVMGFSHEKTKHTFRLIADGGAIEVRAKDAHDTESVDAIRAHLKEIEKDFTASNFTKPDQIHGKLPDGTDVMKELREDITYRFEEVPNGGRIRIRSKNAKAIDAVHRFLKFQIDDHRTGDSKVIEGNDPAH